MNQKNIRGATGRKKKGRRSFRNNDSAPRAVDHGASADWRHHGRTMVPSAVWVVTLATALIAGWQAFETRVSNRHMVRPMLQFVSTSEVASSQRPVVGLYLVNKGMGPAKVVRIEATIGKDKILVGEPGGLTKMALALGLTEEWLGYEFDTSGDETIVSQENVNFLVAGRSASGRELLAAIVDLDVDVVYRSVYGEEYAARWQGSRSGLARALEAYPPGRRKHAPLGE